MNKKLIFLTFLFAIVPFTSFVAKTYPPNIDWTKLQYSYIVSFYTSTPYYPPTTNPGNWYYLSTDWNPFFAFVFVNNVTQLDLGFSTSNYQTVTLTPGVYVVTFIIGFNDTTFAVYRLTGEIVTSIRQTGSTSSRVYWRFSQRYVYGAMSFYSWAQVYQAVQDVFRTASCQSRNWTLLIFNMSGNTFYSYSVVHSAAPTQTFNIFTYPGGSPAVGFVYAYRKQWLQVIGPSTYNLTIGCLYIINDNVVIRADGTLLPVNRQTLVYYTLNVTTIPRDYTIQFYVNGTLDASGVGTLAKQYVNGSIVEYRIYRQSQLVYNNTVVMNRDYTFVHQFSLLPANQNGGIGGGSGGGSWGSSWNSGWNGSWNSSWNPVPMWAQEWTQKNVGDYIRYPFRILVEMIGLQLLSAVVYGVIMFATFMHTKSAFATGVVSMIMATAMIMVLPELVWISYVALAFGIAAVVYEVAKKVV